MARMTKHVIGIGTLALIALTAGVSASAETLLSLHSQPGDYIGQGLDYLFTPADGTFQTFAYARDASGIALTNGLVSDVNFRFLGNTPGTFVNLIFAMDPLDKPLVPGIYEDARRARTLQFGHPGLDVSMNGRGSNTLTGSFTILDAVFDYSTFNPGNDTFGVTSFAATFEQHSEGATPALFGTFYYNYTPAAVPEPDSLALFVAVGLTSIGLLRRRKKILVPDLMRQTTPFCIV